jgi:ADP-heptose:LPS heptosyltransferase
MTIKQYVDAQLKHAGYDVGFEYISKNPYIENVHWTDFYCWKKEEDYNKFHELYKGKFQLVWEMTHGLSWGWLNFINTRINAEKKSNKKNKSKATPQK